MGLCGILLMKSMYGLRQDLLAQGYLKYDFHHQIIALIKLLS